jgi:hypothetical protein
MVHSLQMFGLYKTHQHWKRKSEAVFTMEDSSFLHFLSTDYGSDLHESLYVIAGLQQRELARQEEEKNHASGPNVDGCIMPFQLSHVRLKLKCLTTSLLTAL